MPVTVPPPLRLAVIGDDGGAEWLDALGGLVDRAAERWGLVVGEPFGAGMAAWTAPATTASGADVVVKISYPHEEARDEGAALAFWKGAGSIELLDSDRDDWALLLPRLQPGTSLRDAALPDDHHLAVGAALLRRMATVRRPAVNSFRELVEMAAGLAHSSEERLARLLPRAPYPVDVGLCRQAIDLLRTLPLGATQCGLAHGDLNPGNILHHQYPSGTEAESAEWVAIDPKPVYGDLAWDPWPLLTQVGDWLTAVSGPANLADRTRLVADATELDAPRVASWCTARSVVSGLWAADRGWWTGFRGADGDLARAAAWAGAARLLGG